VFAGYENFNASKFASYLLIEGVGYTEGFIDPFISSDWSYLVCFEKRNIREYVFGENNPNADFYFSSTQTPLCMANIINGIDDSFTTLNTLETYPNPSKGSFTIENSKQESSSPIKLYDVLGTLHYQTNEYTLYNNQMNITLPESCKGVFWLELSNGQRTKIVVQ
jgi:hypothetical protein